MRAEAGRRIGGRYTLVERIASGGMGSVWRAHDEVLDRPVALKLLGEQYASDPSFLERFRAEARNTAALSHPGIANVFDYGEVEGSAYLVMELVDGEPLSTVLARESPLPVDRTLDILGQTAFALQAAHDAGVVHRDVKPGNLLLRRDGVVKVTDFGIARVTDAAPLTRTGTVIGTAQYLSPEQGAGRATTPASDVYSLGVVGYECLVGRRPFGGDTPVAIAVAHLHEPPPPLPDSVPLPVRSLVEQALAKDPRHRPASAGEFGRTALALRELVGGGTDRTAAPSVRPPVAARPAGATTSTRVLPVAAVGTLGTTDAAATAPTAPAAALTRTPLRSRPTPEQRRVRNVLLLIALLVVVVGALVLRSCASGGTVRVPSLRGDTAAGARYLLQRDGLTAQLRSVRRLTDKGLVVAQTPPAGATLGTGSTVTLYVATGPWTVTVSPNSYIGVAQATVLAALRGLGLVPVTQQTPSAQPAGTVVNVYPSGPVLAGSTVTVYVAAAPPPPRHHDHGDKGGGGG